MCKEGADCGGVLDGRIYILDAAEMNGFRQGINWSRSLIEQLPADHEGRNSWLLNFGAVKPPENKVPLADFGKPDVTAGRVGPESIPDGEVKAAIKKTSDFGADGPRLAEFTPEQVERMRSRFNSRPSGSHGQKLEPVKTCPSIADERAALAAERETLTRDVFASLSELDEARKGLAAELVASIEKLLWPKPVATTVSAEPLQPAPEGFSIGDVVMLRSGGPQMTVIAQKGAGRVACAWFNGADERFSQDFPSGALKAK